MKSHWLKTLPLWIGHVCVFLLDTPGHTTQGSLQPTGNNQSESRFVVTNLRESFHFSTESAGNDDIFPLLLPFPAGWFLHLTGGLALQVFWTHLEGAETQHLTFSRLNP